MTPTLSNKINRLEILNLPPNQLNYSTQRQRFAIVVAFKPLLSSSGRGFQVAPEKLGRMVLAGRAPDDGVPADAAALWGLRGTRRRRGKWPWFPRVRGRRWLRLVIWFEGLGGGGGRGRGFRAG